MADDLKRVVAWKNLPMKGTDYCALWHTAEGWLLSGTVVGVLEDQRPMLANYQVHCYEDWLTQRVHVERTIGKHEGPNSERGEGWPVARLGAGGSRSARLSGR